MDEQEQTVKTLQILLTAAISGIVFLTLGSLIKKSEMQDDAVRNGVAFYNPTNAVFTWKTNFVNEQ